MKKNVNKSNFHASDIVFSHCFDNNWIQCIMITYWQLERWLKRSDIPCCRISAFIIKNLTYFRSRFSPGIEQTRLPLVTIRQLTPVQGIKLVAARSVPIKQTAALITLHSALPSRTSQMPAGTANFNKTAAILIVPCT